MGKLLFGTFLIAVPGILIWSCDRRATRREFQMMLAAMVLIIFNVVFWTLFEQAGSSLTLFADRNTDLVDLRPVHASRPAQTQSSTPLFIVAAGADDEHPVDWLAQARAGAVDPGQVRDRADAASALGFLFLVWGASFAGPDFKVGALVAGGALPDPLDRRAVHLAGRALSMITKLSIARIVGLMMGVWFLSISVAQYVAGVVAQVASVETVGGQVTNLEGQPRHLCRRVQDDRPRSRSALGVLLLLLSLAAQEVDARGQVIG